jgi:hypothetical protein
MMRRILAVVTVSALALSVVPHFTDEAAAQETTESRQVSRFRRIEAEGPGRLVVTVGPTESLQITASASDLRRIETEIDGDTLDIEFEGGTIFNRGSGGTILYEVTVPSLVELDVEGGIEAEVTGIIADGFDLEVSGRSQVRIDGLETSSLDVELSGASTVQISGAVTSQDVDVSALSEYRALLLDSRFASVEASGGSLARVRVQEVLDAEASGRSRIEYIGENVRIVEEVSATSSLVQLPFEALPSATPEATPAA